jgi:hypothetical protein
MGGHGSGRRGYRPVVEDGFKLSAYYFQRYKLLNGASGVLYWPGPRAGEWSGSISYRSSLDSSEMWLSYTTKCGGESHAVSDSIRLTTTRSNFGGTRYWWVCPSCHRRCAKLYLPNAVYFRCRRCYNLTYRSSNESGKFDLLYRVIAKNLHLTPAEVKKAMPW